MTIRYLELEKTLGEEEGRQEAAELVKECTDAAVGFLAGAWNPKWPL